MSHSKTKISTDKMTLDDLSFVLKTQLEAGLSFWSADDYSNELLRSDSISLIIKENDIQKGFVVARFITSNNAVEIYNIGVGKNDRRRGFGKILLECIIEICLQNNIEATWLEVRKSNITAINFYKKHGFKIISERKNSYTLPLENAYVMKRTLAEHDYPAGSKSITSQSFLDKQILD